MLTDTRSTLPDDQRPTVDVRWPRPGVALVDLGGEHDLDSAAAVEQAAGGALLACTHLIVDLSHVQFVDSSIINLLVHLRKEAGSLDRRFNVVTARSSTVEHALEICGVVPTLNRVGSLDEALAETPTR